MSVTDDLLPDPAASEASDPAPPSVASPAQPRMPAERVRPITNRFLFVDVASMRAKQLKRGALPRLEGLVPSPVEPVTEVPTLATAPVEVEDEASLGVPPVVQHHLPVRPERKLERVAVEEVREGLVEYQLPDEEPATEPKA